MPRACPPRTRGPRRGRRWCSRGTPSRETRRGKWRTDTSRAVKAARPFIIPFARHPRRRRARSDRNRAGPPGRKKRQAKTPTRTGTVARTVDRGFTPPPPRARSPPSPSRLSAARPPPPPPTPSRASLPRPSPRTARPATSRRAPLPPRRAPRRRRPRPARRRVRETSRVSPSALAIDRSPHSHHDRTALSRRPPPCPPRPNPRSPRTCTPSSASPRRRRPRRSAARTATSSPRRVREGSIPASFRDRPERDRSPSSRGPPPPLPRPEP